MGIASVSLILNTHLDAAAKQSIADKTGNLVLKRTAALEQSLADKMAYVSAPGITTTALRAGRKGTFFLFYLFLLFICYSFSSLSPHG